MCNESWCGGGRGGALKKGGWNPLKNYAKFFLKRNVRQATMSNTLPTPSINFEDLNSNRILQIDTCRKSTRTTTKQFADQTLF